MLSISEDPDRALLLFQPPRVKKTKNPPLRRLISLFLSTLSNPPFFFLISPVPLLTTLTSHFPPPPLQPDAAEESKAEEATPADAAAEATESKDD